MTRALIADDERHLAEHLAARLAALWPGLEILPLAANGLEALAAIGEDEPEVAFLDIRMPGLTGLEVAGRIDARTHVVFVTAYDQYAIEAFDRDAVDYLLKPVGEERLARAVERLKVVVPLTLAIIVLLLYLNFRNAQDVLLILGALPFALVGGVWLLYLLDYDLSIAAAVGFIALAGVAAETGVVMVMYLEHAWSGRQAQARADGREPTRTDLREAIVEGALLRLRPKLMTVITIIVGLLPIMWGSGTGSEVMRRIAAPMVGGMVSATVLTLVIIPSIYLIVNGWSLSRAVD